MECKTCGGPLAPNYGPGRQRQFCSDRCRKAQYDLECVVCGGRVDGTSPGKMHSRDEPVCGTCAPGYYARWPADAVIAAIRAWHERCGSTPTAAEWRRAASDHPAASEVQRRFGSWNAGLVAAGVETRAPGQYERPGGRPEVIAETAELYRSGLTIYEVAERQHIAPSTVWTRLVRAGERRRSRADYAAA